MIVQELINENLTHTYSNEGKKILQVETDILYDEAVDTAPCRFTYKETEIPREELEE